MRKTAVWLYIIIFILLLTGIGITVVLNPAFRFRSDKLPVLATPPAYHHYSNTGLPKFREGFNILILALDTWDNSNGRADMIMIVHIDPSTRRINVVSIPRDTKVLAGKIGWTKINHLPLLAERKEKHSKTKAIMNTVCSLFECDLNYYITINFRGFENFIDRLGGLEIQLEHPVELTFKKIKLASGKHLLDGNTVLELARERYSLKQGDFSRQHHQLQILKALASQLFKPANFKHLPILIKDFRNDVAETNLSEADFIALARLMRKLPEGNLKYYQIPGKSQKGTDPLTHTRVYYWNPDLEGVKRIGKNCF